MSETKTYALFVGANNQTKEVEKDKVVGLVTGRFDGFTLVDSSGYWKGTPEKSVIVLVNTDKHKGEVERLITDLKIALDQQAVGLIELPTMFFL